MIKQGNMIIFENWEEAHDVSFALWSFDRFDGLKLKGVKTLEEMTAQMVFEMHPAMKEAGLSNGT